MTENEQIRTLYVSPVKSNVRIHLCQFFQLTIIKNLFIQIKNDIEKYFKLYGQVEKVRFVSKTKFFGYCFVQFETEESARAALANIKHRIGNYTVKVKPGDRNINQIQRITYIRIRIPIPIPITTTIMAMVMMMLTITMDIRHKP